MKLVIFSILFTLLSSSAFAAHSSQETVDSAYGSYNVYKVATGELLGRLNLTNVGAYSSEASAGMTGTLNPELSPVFSGLYDGDDGTGNVCSYEGFNPVLEVEDESYFALECPGANYGSMESIFAHTASFQIVGFKKGVKAEKILMYINNDKLGAPSLLLKRVD